MAERESVYLWSVDSTSNGSADPSVNFSEGQLPSTVNNSNRAVLAAAARYVKDTTGRLLTTGSANTFAVTINETWTAYGVGRALSIKASFSNTSSTATLNVTNADATALGAKAIRGQGDVALVAGNIVSGGRYDVQYDSGANGAAGAWILLNPSAVASNGVTNTTGEIRLDIAGLTEKTAASAAPSADFLALFDTASTAHKKVKPASLSVGFSAHKNGTHQTAIANATFTKITFPTEIYDVGGYYDTASSRWTPPAGLVQIVAAVYLTTINTGTAQAISIYKNGTRFKDFNFTAAGGSDCGVPACQDQANGTDYYEVFAYANSPSSATPWGDTYATYFNGKLL